MLQDVGLMVLPDRGTSGTVSGTSVKRHRITDDDEVVHMDHL